MAGREKTAFPNFFINMKHSRNFQLEPFIFLYITERCQLRCRHCYMGDRLQSPREMSLDEITELLKYFKTIGHYKLYLLGGEPLLHPEVEKIILLANDLGFEVVVTSNGQSDIKRFQKITPATAHSFSFSFDSCDESVHDQIRGKGTFRRLVQSVEEARKRGFQVRLICTVSGMNMENSLDLIDFSSKKLKVNMLSYHYFSPIGLGKDKTGDLISPEEWMKFCRDIESYPIPDNFWVYYPPTFVYSDDLPHFVERGYKGCTARWLERLAILPSGRVYVCSVFFDTDRNFGQWEDGRLEIRDSGRTEMGSILKIDENCVCCPNQNLCSGGCGAIRDLDKNFPGVVTSRTCDQKIVPMCPLWTTYASGGKPPSRIQELR